MVPSTTSCGPDTINISQLHTANYCHVKYFIGTLVALNDSRLAGVNYWVDSDCVYNDEYHLDSSTSSSYCEPSMAGAPTMGLS